MNRRSGTWWRHSSVQLALLTLGVDALVWTALAFFRWFR
jgi:hypothetical protein